jgi:hypothetical protein
MVIGSMLDVHQLLDIYIFEELELEHSPKYMVVENVMVLDQAISVVVHQM